MCPLSLNTFSMTLSAGLESLRSQVWRNIPYLYLAEALAERPAAEEVRVDAGGEDEGARAEVVGRHRGEHEARLAAHATRSVGQIV